LAVVTADWKELTNDAFSLHTHVRTRTERRREMRREKGKERVDGEGKRADKGRTEGLNGETTGERKGSVG
jgi:hypothetical protein